MKNLNPEFGGPLWDIFLRENVPKLCAYLEKHKREFRHINNQCLEEVIHLIHDQTFYLNTKQQEEAERGI